MHVYLLKKLLRKGLSQKKYINGLVIIYASNRTDSSIYLSFFDLPNFYKENFLFI